MSRLPIIVFTDLDGTLLDHDTYRFTAAEPALEKLKQHGIPLIITTSKTMEELHVIRNSLGNAHPFVAENGCVIAAPEGYFPGMDSLPLKKRYRIIHLGRDRQTILDILHRLRDDQGFRFKGFSDMTQEDIAALTGLGLEEARHASIRLSTEPLMWQDTDAALARFSALLAEQGLSQVQGGRFISVSSPVDKGDGVDTLTEFYAGLYGETPVTIALGDSPNDLSMLNRVNVAVIVRSDRSETLVPEHAGRVVRTEKRGPDGWRAAMETLLREYGLWS